MILELPSAAIIFWGPDQIQLYNDGYSVIMGPRHPQHLGSSFRECWPEAYPTIYPWMQRVLQNGETVEVNRTLVPLTRFGFTEEAYFTFSFSPLCDDQGQIAGILQLVTEVTDAVLGERRTTALHELSNQTAHAKTTQDATRLTVEVLNKYSADLPFCLIYVVDPVDQQRLSLSGSTGLSQDRQPFPRELDLRPDSGAEIQELAQAVRERKLTLIENLATRFGSLSAGTWPESPTLGFAAPIAAADQQSVVALLVGGISPRLALDGHYQGFLQLVCTQLATLMATARAYDDERKRAEALAEIDRAKTTFFSNASHELRTPLTLILGPVEDALAQPAKALQGESLEVVHRSALRLLRLVNSLLDFARIEAGRLQPSFIRTDISVLTADLASSFRSLIERAGLRLVVDCLPSSEPVYVDPSQWEKIVLNLISNAFKFTFRGEIAVSVRPDRGQIRLTVRDTGAGIPPHELPHIFDRFHRVEGTKGRSFEGTGIGLSLVQELVKLHGGSIRASSVEGQGTTFEVSIPTGMAHLPADRIVDGETAATDAGAAPYILEASQWLATGQEAWEVSAAALEDVPVSAVPAKAPRREPGRVLVADDNADMRTYLARLLSTRWQVEVAEDGAVALAKARNEPPDLVLSDVMMPGLDGFGLLRALRAHARTSHVPVVLLSARAGEEAVLEGLHTGADDYLVKPFAARELLARVHTHLELARLRREWSAELERANKELEAFSYSVSHDLRAPLRAIDGFSKVVLDEYSNKLDEQGRHYLERVRSAAQRMAQLIDDLLSLSRITRAPVNRERVDMSDLAQKVLSELAGREPTRRTEIQVPEGLVLQADPRLLKVVLENLLGNAWKFTSKQSTSRIEVGKQERNGQAVFFVRDNGAGFNMEYAKRLFAPFQRLHSETEFEGTGIGLATVHRIITRHGGHGMGRGVPRAGRHLFLHPWGAEMSGEQIILNRPPPRSAG